jgi:MFS family permease
MKWNPFVGKYLFFSVALFMGIGFGIMFPAFNTMFVNLAPNNQRATANSTYLTCWDTGIGLGLVFGGYIAQHAGFQIVYFSCGILVFLSAIYFMRVITPYFNKHKLR